MARSRLLRLGIGSLLLTAVAGAQERSEVAVGFGWLSENGSRASFDSQYNLSDGAFLETLELDLTSWLSQYERFDLALSGFGAEPWQKAALKLDWDREWSLRVDYSRRESSFGLASFDLGQRRDDWAITRWISSLTYDGWRPVRLRLDLRDVRRSGTVQFPFYGLGQPYVGMTRLDERTQEAGISVETRTLPVKLLFGQDVARYMRRNRAEVGNDGLPAQGGSEYTLAGFSTPGEDANTVPTSRLAAVYSGPRLEFLVQGMVRKDDLTSTHDDEVMWQREGGVGSISLIDALDGTGDRDQSIGDARIGYSIVSGLTVRLRGHYEDSSSESTLLGDRIIRFTGPGGTTDFPSPVDEQGFIDRKDTDFAAEIEWARGPLGLAVSYHEGSREVAWQRGREEARYDVTRDASGFAVIASLALGRAVGAQIGWDDSSWERYVFRIDPETAQRVWAKLRLRPRDGFELSANVSRERADNPSGVADLDRSTDSLGVAATFLAEGGAFLSATVDLLELDSQVDTVYFAPGATTGLSAYEVSLLGVGVRGALPLGSKLRLEGGVTRHEDRGDSAPFTSWVGDLRLTLDGPFNLGYAVFAESWSYDQADLDADDFDVTRFGLVLRRRF